VTSVIDTVTDQSSRLGRWLDERVDCLDRGWKATLLGVVIVLVIAIAL